jgi:hypothetical protein
MTFLSTALIAGCGAPQSENEIDQSIHCGSGDVPIYTSRFLPMAGASGVATGADATAGRTNSDPGAMSESPPNDPSLTAMTVQCGQAACAPGQVAVLLPPKATPGGGGLGAAAGGSDSTSGGPATGAPPTAAMVVCAEPPPVCPTGQSPQYTIKQTWECTDCSLVVTYGGIYGNYRRCVGVPHLTCSNGEVPTWVFEDDQWECKPPCDNGQYDRHTIAGVMVCVPC